LTYAYKRRIVINIRREAMKTKDLIELLEKNGWKFKRHGANHDIYVKGTERESIVRHKETDEELARAIIRRRGLK
jgi:mRNA interferase HicA